MRGVFFEAWRVATSAAASASICRSTSHSDTTSTGATWISRSRSVLPYQPAADQPDALARVGELFDVAGHARQRERGARSS